LLSVAATLVAVTLTAAQAPDRDTAAGTHKAILEELVRTLDRERARTRLEALVATQPYAPALCNLAVLAEAAGEWDRAIGYLERVAQLPAPQQPCNAGEEIATIRVARTKPPDVRESDAAIQRARAFLRTGLPAVAVAEAADVIRLTPARWEGYALAAAGMSATRQPADAAVLLRHAMARAPAAAREALAAALQIAERDAAFARHMLDGRAAALKHDHAAALQAFDQAERLCPGLGETVLARAVSLAGLGRQDEALTLVMTLRDTTDRGVATRAEATYRAILASRPASSAPRAPSKAATLVMQAESTLAKGGVRDAKTAASVEPAYRNAIALEPRNAGWHWRLAIALAKQKRFAEAEPEYREVLRINPSARARLPLAEVLDQLGRPEEALAVLDEALQKEGPDPMGDMKDLRRRLAKKVKAK